MSTGLGGEAPVVVNSLAFSGAPADAARGLPVFRAPHCQREFAAERECEEALADHYEDWSRVEFAAPESVEDVGIWHVTERARTDTLFFSLLLQQRQHFDFAHCHSSVFHVDFLLC